MEPRIIYLTAEGTVSVIIPNLNSGLSVVEIAQKDVPTGIAYKIVTVADIPQDRAERDAWVVDPAELTDGVGA